MTQMRMGKFGLRKTLAKGSAASSSADHWDDEQEATPEKRDKEKQEAQAGG